MLIEPRDLELTDMKGKKRNFVISKVPATHMREIIAQYPVSALPKIGDYQVNQDMMLKLMSYVGVPPRDKDGKLQAGMAPIMLTTRELIDNHIGDVGVLSKVEIAMFKYNCDFFLPEDLSNLKERWKRIATTFITQILTESLRRSSQPEKPPSQN